MTPAQREAVKRLFAEAVERSAEERDAYLAAHGGADLQVVNEVRSLLAHHDERTLLARPGSRSPANATAPIHLDDTLVRQTSSARTRPFASWTSLRLDAPGYLALGIGLSALLIGIASFFASHVNERLSQGLRSSYLASGINAAARALDLWVEQEQMQAQTMAADPEVCELTQQLLVLADGDESFQTLRDSSLQRQLRQQLRGSLGEDVRYAVWDRKFRTLADWAEDGVGVGALASAYGAALLTRVFEGETVVQLPGVRDPITKGYPLGQATPRVGVVTPIYGANRQIVAAILFYNLGGEDRFNDILAIMQIGDTGEAYAFDRTGLMISRCRFPERLQQAGLMPADVPLDSSLRIFIRDPGGDLLGGYQPASPSATWPLTKAALQATRGADGLDLDGYRNYRGARVIGAWKWWPQQDFGIVMEIEEREIHRTLYYARVLAFTFVSLLGASLLGVLVSLHRLHRLRLQAARQQKLGQYTLERKIGEGGMAVVYLARHALLKRPTAVKVLKAEIANPRTIAWFEREVQLVSQLRHPNTINIYDYGVTDAGQLYYVMEYLDGATLAQYVDRSGPMPWRSGLAILRQVLGSLREAHAAGLVHRDIKPHNIMICDCGGEKDFVKVLDFGLVKQMDTAERDASTVLAGTPLYMAPERIRTPQLVDPRSDLYSVGAVAFFLLTARPIFSDTMEAGLVRQILDESPPRLSDVAPQPIPAGVDQLISELLAKDPDQRPASAAQVLERLEDLAKCEFRTV